MIPLKPKGKSKKLINDISNAECETFKMVGAMTETIAEAAWESLARNMLRAELMRRGLSYARLVEALAAIGVEETEAGIKNKVARGRFTLVFFLQAMAAIGVDWLQAPGLAAIGRGEGVGVGGAQALAKRGSGLGAPKKDI